MLAYFRLIALGLILAATPALTEVAWADSHNQDRLPRGLLGDINKLEANVRRMKDNVLRQYLRDLKRARNSSNADVIDARIRLFEGELQRRQAAGATQEKPAKLSGQERKARRLLQQAAPSKQLNSKALTKRIKTSRKYAQHPKVHDRTRDSLLQLIRQDRGELKRRQAAADQPAVSRDERRAVQLLRQAQSAADLRTPALRERIRETRGLLDSKALNPRTRNGLENLLVSDRREFRQRQAAADVSPAEKDARRFLKQAGPAQELTRRALRQRIEQTEGYLSRSDIRRPTLDGLAELRKADRRELQRRREDSQPQLSAEEDRARRLIANAGDPRRLDDDRLTDRIRLTRDLLAGAALTAPTRASLEELLQRDRRERRARRISDDDTGGNAEYAARSLLRDDRSPQRLSDRDLRNRLAEIRRVLQEPGLTDRTSRALRQRLRDDRRELRTRLEARRSGEDPAGIEPPRSQLAEKLLNDNTPSHALRSRQLSRRIDQAGAVLSTASLSTAERRWLEDMIQSDRRELRQRLRNRRERRRAELDRRRRANELNIVIGKQFDYQPRNDIAAAEADEDVIERQLVAPPTARIDRRYSFDEFRRRPDLRRLMPAVEVDSIHFGFNESFVREEEIDELERLGAVIERVLAANPEEVFLIEGHTDAVGSASYNLALSDKRAEAVRNALIDYFVIRPENLATIGYGEQFLKIPTPEEEQENRRVTVRRITPLLAGRIH